MLNYTGELEELFYEKLDNLLHFAREGRVVQNLKLLGRYDIIEDLSKIDWVDTNKYLEQRAFLYDYVLAKLNLPKLIMEPSMAGNLVLFNGSFGRQKFSKIPIKLDSSSNKLVDINLDKGQNTYFEGQLIIENSNYEYSQVIVKEIKAISKGIYITDYKFDNKNILISFNISVEKELEGAVLQSIILNTNIGLSIISFKIIPKPLKPLLSNESIKSINDFYNYFNEQPETAARLFNDKNFPAWLRENGYKRELANYYALAYGEKSTAALHSFLKLCGFEVNAKLSYEFSEKGLILKNTGRHSVKAIIKHGTNSVIYNLGQQEIKEVDLKGFGDSITLISNGMEKPVSISNFNSNSVQKAETTKNIHSEGAPAKETASKETRKVKEGNTKQSPTSGTKKQAAGETRKNKTALKVIIAAAVILLVAVIIKLLSGD